MITETLLPRLLTLQKTLFASLRLKDVLEASLAQFAELGGGAKVAIFLSDNESLSLKLMNAYGYTEASIEQMRILSFTAETLLKHVVQRRQGAAVHAGDAPDISISIMKRENSVAQLGLPLIAGNLLVGAVQMDVSDISLIDQLDFFQNLADLTAIAVANAILFGRSEYERERLATLYRTSVSLSGSTLRIAEVLQIAADTSLILANTPHCAVLLVDPKLRTFTLAAFKGLDGNSFHTFKLNVENTIAGGALVAGKTEYVSDASAYSGDLPMAPGGGTFGSVVATPLVAGNEPLGVIMLFAQESRAFHREQLELLESLAAQTSTALHVALTHESATAQTIQDAHTSLYNRWHFEEAFAREIERSARHKHSLSLLLLDIDHLSRVNELLGQERGDEVIRHVAKVIKGALRDIDVPARYGAEEFAILLPETPKQNAADVAERLRHTIKSNPVPGIGMVTVSIGMAAFPEIAESAVKLLNLAEEALDVAKYEGRDRVKVAEAETQTPTGPIAWADLAREAKLAVVSEKQSKLKAGLGVPAEYAPWMRAMPGWGSGKKKSDN
ncbi:MAG: diguanylate cyclase [Candidatus Obscuribacterales bacterium]